MQPIGQLMEQYRPREATSAHQIEALSLIQFDDVAQ